MELFTTIFQAHLPKRAIRPTQNVRVKYQASLRTVEKRTGTHTHHAKRSHDNPQPRPPHHTTEHKLVRHELDQARIDQNAGADAIEHALDNQRRLRPGRISPPETQAHRHGHRRRQAVPQAEKIRSPMSRLGPRRGRQAGTETEAFKRLVEDEDDVEGDEFLSCDCEGQADEYGVEYHAEFEDAYRRHLRGVIFDFVRRFVEFEVGGFWVGWAILAIIVVDVLPGVGEVVFAWGMAFGI